MPVSNPSPEQIHLRLTIDVLINPDGETEENLRANLRDIARRASGEGQITGDGPATVEEMEDRVERIS